MLERGNDAPVSSFNPRAHAGRDRSDKLRDRKAGGFQSTRPRRARQTDSIRARTKLMFQSTRPRRARRGAREATPMVIVFQSTRPRRARLWNGRDKIHTLRFQSTRPRRARQRAPGWRRSIKWRFNPRAHAGRDPNPLDQYPVFALFQSTRPRRARHRAFAGGVIIMEVSIHAPAWGATGVVLNQVRAKTGFNPRAHAGRDATAYYPYIRSARFQSTRPRRARRSSVHVTSAGLWPFQSTRPRRARQIKQVNLSEIKLFQSTRPRRARH